MPEKRFGRDIEIDPIFEGLIDHNTGKVSFNRILRQSTPSAEIVAGLGHAGMLLRKALVDKGDAAAGALAKASPDDPEHPGWPAGTEGGVGGQFRPKDDATIEEATKEVVKTATRRAIRTRLFSVLRALGKTALSAERRNPVEEALALKDLIDTIHEIGRLKTDAEVAAEFAKGGPRTLEQLRVGSPGESFTSYEAFLKEDLEKRFGRAGDGYDYHHIVEQGENNSIPPELLQNTDNIIRIPRLLHEEISAVYGKPSDLSRDQPVRQWLRTRPFPEQREYGLKTLRDLGILSGDE